MIYYSFNFFQRLRSDIWSDQTFFKHEQLLPFTKQFKPATVDIIADLKVCSTPKSIKNKTVFDVSWPWTLSCVYCTLGWRCYVLDYCITRSKHVSSKFFTLFVHFVEKVSEGPHYLLSYWFFLESPLLIIWLWELNFTLQCVKEQIVWGALSFSEKICYPIHGTESVESDILLLLGFPVKY